MQRIKSGSTVIPMARSDQNIIASRAEVVTIINRVTERNADTEFIDKNLTAINRFTDVKNNSHWAFYAIEEATNTHIGVIDIDNETWLK